MKDYDIDAVSADAPLIPNNHHNHGLDADEQHHPLTFTLSNSSQSSGNFFVWALTLSAGISGMLFGYDTGVISSTLVSIGTDLSSRNLTTLDKSLITSCTSAFALMASPIAGVFADRIGRKNIILAADALFTFGAAWQALTSTVWGMILGRSIVGLAIGGASLIVPLYISELAPSHLRGRLVTVSLLFITGGQVVAYIIGWIFSSVPGGWRWMVGLGAVPAIAQLLMLFFMPETPRFLCKIQRDAEAKAVLAKIYKPGINTVSSKNHRASSSSSSSDDDDDNEDEEEDPYSTEIVNSIMSAIHRELDEEATAHSNLTDKPTSVLPPTLQSLLFHPPHVRALTITCMLQALQQLCGFNSLMYFSATIFSLLQFSSPTLTSLSIATTNFIFTVAAFYLIDRIGRRRILLITIPLMAVALLLCAGAFTFVTLPNHHQRDTTPAPPSNTTPKSRLPAIMILISLLLYVSPYATGLGPVPWQQSELFPLSVRSLGSSLATATNWGCNTIVGLTFLPMMEWLTPGWTFVCYDVVCVVGWGVVWWIYPETMGLGLEEVGELLRDGWGVKESVERVKRERLRRDREDARGKGLT